MPLRIAIISPLYESVPPKLYGGTERVVSYLSEALVDAGQEVTLFASGDSITRANLVPVMAKSLRLDPECKDPIACHFKLMEEVLRHEREFDIIHSNVDYLSLAFARRARTPFITTLHGRLDIPEVISIFQEYNDFPLISISDAQRKPMPLANWLKTIYHGVPIDLYSFNNEPEEYLVFVGRISPEKKIESLIRIALKAQVPLKIAAKVGKVDREYYETVVRPLLDNSLIEFLGEVNDREKNGLLGNAMACLHPADWPEPFGLALIEAMCCGTPVVARKRGSIPEVVDHGVTGFIFDKDEEAVLYIKNQLPSISRTGCRRRFEERFSSRRMSADYLAAYKAVIASGYSKGEAQKDAIKSARG